MNTFPQELQLTRQQIEVLINWASKNPVILSVYVIGSRAIGTAKPDSDLDLALDLYTTTGPDNNQLSVLINYRKSWREELTKSLGLKIKDIQLANDAGDPTYGAAQNHGILVYSNIHDPNTITNN